MSLGEIGRARKATGAAHGELITATEVRRELGVYEQKLYAWVAAGAVTAYRSRFTKYTLYSKMEIIRALQLAFSVAEKAA